MTYVSLSIFDLILAASLMLINGIISWAFALKLERTLLLNTVRMVAQLALIGFVLKWIFAHTSLSWTLALAIFMIAIAGVEILLRQPRKLKGLWSYGLATATMFAVGTLVTLFAVAGIIGPEPWYQPRYVLPILGMVLGNAMTGVSLVLSSFVEGTHQERAAIETRLALGQPRFEALETVLRKSLHTGLMPILNAMAISGLVALPGMMTGQILAGADPVDAAKYQIMIMFVIAGATALGVVMAGFGAVYLVSDTRHRLRMDSV